MSIAALGWSLIHSLWQGALVALGLAAALAVVRRRAAGMRYLLCLGALALLVLLPAATYLQVHGSGGAAAGDGAATGAPASAAAAGERAEPASLHRGLVGGAAELVAPRLPWIVAAWLAGVLVFSMRLAGGWLGVRRLATTEVRPAPGPVQESLRRRAEAMGLRRVVRIARSERVSTPMVVGWLRPVILVPSAALFGLDPAQLEAILAHELAHVRRHDALVNLFQSVVEALLFYHPAAWWISRQVRIEREHCCDDAGVAACGDPLVYARALVRLEELRRPVPRLAVAASGTAARRGRGSLRSRVGRLVEPAEAARSGTAAGPLAAVLALLAVAALGAGTLAAGPAPSAPEPSPAAPSSRLAGFPPEERALLARYGVDEAYVRGLSAAGLEGLAAGELVTLRRYGVDGEYVAALSRLGYPGLSVHDLATLRRYDVEPAWLEAVRAAGYRDLGPGRLVELRRYGVSGPVLARLREAGERPAPEELVDLVRYGLLSDRSRGGGRP